MSVKSKIKRLNKEIEILKNENILLTDHILQLEVQKNNKSKREKLLENIVKFAITNQIGHLRSGMVFDLFEIDKMSDLKLEIHTSDIEHAHILRVRY